MFSVIDAGQLCLAIVACGIVVVLPGLALARLFGVARPPARPDVPMGVVVGLASLPLLDSLVARLIGLDAALAMTLALALLGMLGARHGTARGLSAWPILAACIWFVIVTAEWIDIDVAGKLFHPFLVIDAVKHAATAQAILDSGAPPRDAFFLRPEHASYYYFFYTLAALASRLCAGLLEARAAVGGLIFWAGIGVYGLVHLAIARAGWTPAGDRTRLRVIVLAILLASGLDIIGVLRMGLLQGIWLADPISWNEQVAGWLESLLWVPHHVTGLIAGMVALISLTDAVNADADRRSKIRAIGLTAICCASTLGLSVWLMLGLATTIAIWCVILLIERRWSALAIVAAVGVLALLAALPQILDLRAGRAIGPFPIVPTIRAFTPVDGLFVDEPWRGLARLVALPLNCFAGFGVLASGGLLFWTRRDADRRSDFATILAIAAISGLLLGAFLKSTIFNNDLGWRVVLYPLFAGTVWTIVAIDGLVARADPARGPAWRAIPKFLLLLLGLGWSTSLYALVSLRTYPMTATEPAFAFMSADPETDRGLRISYDWANHDLPASAVLQHDPTRSRAFAFGLFGHQRTAVSDTFGALYGADPAEVDTRIAALAPIFRDVLPAAAIRARAKASGIDDLVVTRDDPVWSNPRSFVWSVKPIYASQTVRIIAVDSLATEPNATLSAR